MLITICFGVRERLASGHSTGQLLIAGGRRRRRRRWRGEAPRTRPCRSAEELGFAQSIRFEHDKAAVGTDGGEAVEGRRMIRLRKRVEHPPLAVEEEDVVLPLMAVRLEHDEPAVRADGG